MITLYDHQAKTVEEAIPILRQYNIVCLSMEVRTGKTFTSLSIAAEYGAKSVLFVTKKKAISSIEGDYKELSPAYKIKVINFESLHKIEGHLYDFVIIDEAHSLGAFPKTSKRVKNLKFICKGKPIIYLSGTFSPETYVQLYHQFYISSFSPWKQHTNFYKWVKAGFVNIKQMDFGYGKVNNYKEGNEKKIKDTCKHLFVSVSQTDADFDSPVIEHKIYVPMTGVQKKMIRDIKYDKFCKHDKYEIYATPQTGADTINKISQICGGSLIFDDEDKGRIITGTKAKYILDNFKGQKIAIIYKYKTELDILKYYFPNWTTDVDEFRNDDSLTFIGQIRSVQEGVDLSSADSQIMYNIDFSATSYFQGRSRMQNKKRTKPCNVYWLFTQGGIEDKVYKAVTAKKHFTFSYYNKN